ncbi:MAG: hypothetical protein IJA43_02375 [Clostridia bacterium]|nr:hypothetical protein [Clostridia bacterium]
MEIQYIFISKSKSNIEANNTDELLKKTFNDVFDNVTKNTFQISISGLTQTISFKRSPTNEGVTYLTLNYEGSPYLSAKTLSIVNDRLQKGEHRKNFHIILSYDGPSEYYCDMLASRFGKFERLMRSFIYISLTKSLGIEWFENSFTKEMKVLIKEKGNISDGDLIEHGLYEMTFAQLYDYLFKEFSYCSPDTAIYNQLLGQNLDGMEKSEIIEIINSCKKECLWNRFFSDAKFNLEEPLRDMRKYRNIVAHNKLIKYEEYNKCKWSLIKINRTLESAIEQLNLEIYTKEHLTNSVMSLVALFAGLLKNEYGDFSVLQNNFNALGKVFLKAFEPYADTSKILKYYQFGSVLSDLQKLSTSLSDRRIVEMLANLYYEKQNKEIDALCENSKAEIADESEELDAESNHDND